MDEFEIETICADESSGNEIYCDERQIDVHCHYAIEAAQYQNAGCGCLLPMFSAFFLAAVGMMLLI